jgi:hypothetical protein
MRQGWIKAVTTEELKRKGRRFKSSYPNHLLLHSLSSEIIDLLSPDNALRFTKT